MVKRMKKVFKKEKGFTLVELLAVIVILGLILAIAIPSIGKVIGNSETKVDEANVKLIENAARLAYVTDADGDCNASILEETGCNVAILVKAGYLTEEPVIPGTEDKYEGTVKTEDKGKTFDYDPEETTN